MLKVVGASWVQTRIMLFTLAAVTMVGVLTYYYGGAQPASHDGNYSATAFWSKTAGYRLQFWGQSNDPSAVRQGVARAYYRPDMKADGWASMEIETQEQYPDRIQAHAAGLLEGSLSWQLIYYHWKNTIEKTCEDRHDFCEQARIIIDQNTANIREQAEALDQVDSFWHQVNLFYEQLDGLEVGWRYAVDRSRKDFDIPHEDFLWMNMACDLRDLELMYNASLEANPDRPSLSMALLKLVPDDPSQFLLAHASSSYYSAMLRVQKRYHMRLHMTGASGAPLVPGGVVTFTSYPGTVHSQDDFYQVSGGSGSGSDTPLTVTGTAIKNLNQALWARAEVTTQVLMGPRVMAANRLATNGSEWARLVNQSYSGTGNKQWLVVQPGRAAVRLWVVEQLPGITLAEEHTHTLADAGYWASYGLPHFKAMLEISGNSVSPSPVAKALSDGQQNVTDVESLVSLMRSPDLTLAGRSDLSLAEVTGLQQLSQGQGNNLGSLLYTQLPHYQHNDKEVMRTQNAVNHLKQELQQMEGHRGAAAVMEEIVVEELPAVDLLVNKRKIPDTDERKVLSLREFSGVIDLKVSKKDSFLAAAGPPFSVSQGAVVVQPFQWSKSPIKDLPHVGQADVWNFDPVQPKWVWN